MTEEVLAHAGWLQAAGRQAIRSARPLRIVHLADATAPARHPAAQAVAQLARCATLAQPGLIDVFSIALDTARPDDLDPVAQLAARLLWAGDATALRGAELLARPGWIGLRSHPEPLASVSFGTPDLPSWIGDWLAQAVATAPGTPALSKLARRRPAPHPPGQPPTPGLPSPAQSPRPPVPGPVSPAQSPPPGPASRTPQPVPLTILKLWVSLVGGSSDGGGAGHDRGTREGAIRRAAAASPPDAAAPSRRGLDYRGTAAACGPGPA